MELPQLVFGDPAGAARAVAVRSTPPPPQSHSGTIPCLSLMALVLCQGIFVINHRLREIILRGHGIPNLLLLFCTETLAFALGISIDGLLGEHSLFPRSTVLVLFVWIPCFGLAAAIIALVVPSTRRLLRPLCASVLDVMLPVRLLVTMQVLPILFDHSPCLRFLGVPWLVTDTLRNLYSFRDARRNELFWY